MFIRKILALILILGITPQVFAQSDEEQRYIIAREVVTLAKMNEMAAEAAALIVPRIMPGIRAEIPNATDAQMEQVEAIFLEAFQNAGPLYADLYAEIYADHFSLEELLGLEVFFSSEVGRAYIEKQPLLLREAEARSARIGQEIIQDKLADLHAIFEN
ncbi:DUF2059 domain-containing protein [Woodsholea maritima]|uniref:DUF2059 domain-containing protein n=1 Tax=Woodsholea maritima TaxID=240237 RepID=UPI000371C270|nr:DUF2059 domain-containing protein [Woodsholea maritima]